MCADSSDRCRPFPLPFLFFLVRQQQILSLYWDFFTAVTQVVAFNCVINYFKCINTLNFVTASSYQFCWICLHFTYSFFNFSLCPFLQLLSNRRQPPEEAREEGKKDDLTVFRSCLYQCLDSKPPWSKKVYLKADLCPALLDRT